MDPETTSGDRPPAAALAGIGCLTAVSGTFAGGMIAVLIGKIVGSLRGCQPPDGTPACDWSSYAAVGMLLGFLVFPTITIMRLRRRRS